MDPQLALTRDLYRQSQERLHRLLDGLPAGPPDDAFNRKPGPRSWSVGECVVHLNRMSKGYLPVLEEAAALDGPRGKGPFGYGWVATKFIDAQRPGSRSIRTVKAMRPPPTDGRRSAINRARALARFDADTDRYVAAVERADGLDIGRVMVRSPFLPILRLPLGAFFEALGHHALRHVAQAERVARTAG